MHRILVKINEAGHSVKVTQCLCYWEQCLTSQEPCDLEFLKFQPNFFSSLTLFFTKASQQPMVLPFTLMWVIFKSDWLQFFQYPYPQTLILYFCISFVFPYSSWLPSRWLKTCVSFPFSFSPALLTQQAFLTYSVHCSDSSYMSLLTPAWAVGKPC